MEMMKANFPCRINICVGLFPANTLIPLLRLQSLAFGFRTFAYACKRPSFLASRRFATGKPDTDVNELSVMDAVNVG